MAPQPALEFRMHRDWERSSDNRHETRVALSQHAAFGSMTAAVVALIVALALDFTNVVPMLAGKATYNPIRDFLSYQVDAQSGQLMTGVFLLQAVAAWSYAISAFVAPNHPRNRFTIAATVVFGLGLFVGACFRAVPKPEIAQQPWLANVSRLHDIGIGGGFIPAMIAAFIDQRKIIFKRAPGFLLMKISFWMIVIGAVSTAVAAKAFQGVEGLTQRIFVVGIVLWLITESHQLFWSSVGGSPTDGSSSEK